MLSKTTRRNLVRLLRSTILVSASQAETIVRHSWAGIDGPIHDAKLVIVRFNADGSGAYDVEVDGEGVGGGILQSGSLNRWLASPEGIAAVAAANAAAALEETLMREGVVVSITESTRWTGTAQIELEDGLVLPMIPLVDETGQDLVDLHHDLTPGKRVRLRVVPACEIVDDFARTLDQTQPCVDWVMEKQAA